jgi:hypothetical protein
MSNRPNGSRVVVAVALGLLMVCVGGMATATASPVSPSASGTIWAYGAIRTIDVSGHNASGGYSYQGSALFGFSAILNQSPTTHNNFSLTITRAMGVSLSLEYCIPTCHAPLYTASVQYRAWEVTSATAGLTTAANVTELSGPVAALGLRNETGNLSAGIRETTQYATGSTVLLSRQLWVNESGIANLTLTPALGLIPLVLVAGTSWNATSAFTASGSYEWSWALLKSGSTVPTPLRTNGSGGGVLNRTGNVTVLGNFSSGSTVVLGGATYDAINLSVVGPFVLREGVVLLPAGANLFSGASTAWSSAQFGSATVSVAHLDISGHVMGAHLGVAASAAWWRSGSTDPTAAVAGFPMTPAGATDSSAPTYVQGQPESTQQAQSDQQCLASGAGCPTLPGGAPPRGVLGLLLLTGAVGVTIALVAAGTFSRRRLPPPVYPNASLYPPGTAVTGGPGGGPTPPTPPPVEDDPLGHLW